MCVCACVCACVVASMCKINWYILANTLYVAKKFAVIKSVSIKHCTINHTNIYTTQNKFCINYKHVCIFAFGGKN